MHERRFEQGSIRSPPEAHGLPVRVSRGCPSNQCAFCPVYEGEDLSLRSLEHVFESPDFMRDVYGYRPRIVTIRDLRRDDRRAAGP